VSSVAEALRPLFPLIARWHLHVGNAPERAIEDRLTIRTGYAIVRGRRVDGVANHGSQRLALARSSRVKLFVDA
jgi:hypothetical protein